MRTLGELLQSTQACRTLGEWWQAARGRSLCATWAGWSPWEN